MFSLILATYGRGEEARPFLKSLCNQSLGRFQLIAVDQNRDDRFLNVLRGFERSLPFVQYVRADRPGLSLARNLALSRIEGSIVAFPDDDCAYPPDLLERVAAFFESHPRAGGLTTTASSFEGIPLNGFDHQAGWIDRRNVWKRGISVGIFLRSPVVRTVGPFDEQLGLGAKFGSGEETDYLLRALAAGVRVYFDSSLAVLHPEPTQQRPDKMAARGYQYGLGFGRVLRKHRFPRRVILKYLVRSFGGTVIERLRGNPGKSNFQWSVFRGRLEGWRCPR